MAGIYKSIIQGHVLEDINFDEIREGFDGGLSNITINLFKIIDKEKYTEGKSEIIVYREKYIGSTKTDNKGEFKFNAGKGLFAVALDINSLPDGMGTTQINKLVNENERASINFIVRNIANIEFDNIPREVSLDDAIVLNPVLKDKRGNLLAAKVSLISDSSEITFSSGMLRSKPISLRKKHVNIYAVAGNIRKQVSIVVDSPYKNSSEKVSLAYRSGMIDEHKRILNSLYSLFDKSKLPEEFRSKIPIKSGTGILNDIQKYIKGKNAVKSVVEEAKRYLSSQVPELDKIYKSPEGFFNIHYTTNGDNAVLLHKKDQDTVPPYIVEVGYAFDLVKRITCDERGFRLPVFDEGKASLDIYVYDLKGVYGMTVASKNTSDSNDKLRTATGFICIDNNYSKSKGFDKSREDCMKVTAAHEFFHAVQNAYNADADTWWKEACATWNEDEVFHGINDYIRYLDRFFSSPNKSLDENSYSGVVFVKFLSENLGGYEIIKSIWNFQSSQYNESIKAIDRAIISMNKMQDIGKVFNKFTAYNVNPRQYYKEGSLWNVNVAVQSTYSSYPVPSNSGKLDHLASEYHLFKSVPDMYGKTLKLVVDGAEGVREGYKIQKKKRGENIYQLLDISSDAKISRIEIEMKNFMNDYEEAYLIPANLETELNGVTYSYSADVF